ncbi:MAG: hypothetical protein QM820_19400 [Minicystis sp.]
MHTEAVRFARPAQRRTAASVAGFWMACSTPGPPATRKVSRGGAPRAVRLFNVSSGQRRSPLSVRTGARPAPTTKAA